MTAGEWVMQQVRAAEYRGRRAGAWIGAFPGLLVGLALMLAVHLLLSMHADGIHERALATIREAEALERRTIREAGDARLRECVGIVEVMAGDSYERVVAFRAEHPGVGR